jgi:hypothetical protein
MSMHDVIHRALATQAELDRLTAARAARTRRTLKQEQAGPRTSGALRVPALRPRRIGAGE